MPGFSLLLLLAALHSPGTKRYPLPPDARIHIGKTQDLSKKGIVSGNDGADCAQFTFTKAEIRHQFATYRLQHETDMHNFYSVGACDVEGTVTVHGKTFYFGSNEGNVLGTTYPDGVMKSLGGEPSGWLGEQ